MVVEQNDLVILYLAPLGASDYIVCLLNIWYVRTGGVLIDSILCHLWWMLCISISDWCVNNYNGMVIWSHPLHWICDLHIYFIVTWCLMNTLQTLSFGWVFHVSIHEICKSLYVHTHTYIHIHAHAHTHTHIHTYLHSIHTCMLICIFISIHTCSFAYFVYAYMEHSPLFECRGSMFIIMTGRWCHLLCI